MKTKFAINQKPRKKSNDEILVAWMACEIANNAKEVKYKSNKPS